MSDPNRFSESTKRYLATRAGWRCSFEGCNQLTVGPGTESDVATINIGEAAHISAASPGGKRYDESLSPEDRSSINNGIWLCAHHATLIDRDGNDYTIARLHEMKNAHVLRCGEELKRNPRQPYSSDLISIGPEIIVLGEVTEVGANEWSVRFQNCVDGDFSQIVKFIDQCESLHPSERYLLVNSLGDGRQLSQAPTISKEAQGYLLRCPVMSRFPRISAHELGSQMATHPETNDVYLEDRQIARVSGLDSLPQQIRQTLSLRRDESPFHPLYGTQLADYFKVFRDTPWLGKLIELEVIRQASIPYTDEISNHSYTPLRCIDRVLSVTVLSDALENRRLPLRIEAEVHGVGFWSCEVSVLLEFNVSDRPSSWDALAN